MDLYTIDVEDRTYETFSTRLAETDEPIQFRDLNPFACKLFHGDVFTMDENGMPTIVSSGVRSLEHIPAVLTLEDNKTYGREKNKTDKNSRMWYKCVPNDSKLPCFLVRHKPMCSGFSKVLTNMYVTIRFTEWTEKHPRANLAQTIGPVDILQNFYEYQLYCKHLKISFSHFQKEVKQQLKTLDSKRFIDSFGLEDRSDWHVFTIDPSPKGCIDFDDAMSIKHCETGYILSVYIANIPLLLDMLNLWPAFAERVSKIYLPDKQESMIPNELSKIASLSANSKRATFAMDIFLDTSYNVKNVYFTNVIINVHKNYAYEEPCLLTNPDYLWIKEVVTCMSKKDNILDCVADSHHVVEYLMIFMNHWCAKILQENGNGIFRTATLIENITNKFAEFRNVYAQYTCLEFLTNDINLKHDVLELNEYVHITSPIRRMVDILNMIKIQENLNIFRFSLEATNFYNKWITKMDYINKQTKAIRKVQNDCTLLYMCSTNETILKRIYTGYCFEKGENKCTVFLPELKLTTSVKMLDDVELGKEYQFKLFVFNDESKFKKKIRIQLA